MDIAGRSGVSMTGRMGGAGSSYAISTYACKRRARNSLSLFLSHSVSFSSPASVSISFHVFVVTGTARYPKFVIIAIITRKVFVLSTHVHKYLRTEKLSALFVRVEIIFKIPVNATSVVISIKLMAVHYSLSISVF